MFGLVHAFCAEYVCIPSQSRLKPKEEALLSFPNFAVKVLHSICQQNLENSAVATGLEKVSFHPNPKERQCQRMFRLLHN